MGRRDMPKIKNKSKFKISIVPAEEIESGRYFRKEEAAKRNLSDYLKLIIESFEAQIKIMIDKIEINRNVKQEIISVIIKEKI